MRGEIGTTVSKGLSGIFSGIKTKSYEKALINRLKRGIDNKEFRMHPQFIVDNKTKRIVSGEALSRWESPEEGIIMPGKYIGVMEKSGLIVSFDYYMFEMVCEKLNAWSATEFCDVTMSCNFTRITISESDFVEKIKNIAEKYDFDRSKLIIEITEDFIEKNAETAIRNIKQIKELGFTIALDDVGSGYTTLLSLCEYPIDIVKLDREMLLHTNKENGRKLFLGIISLIHDMNLKVVCEGVETEEHNDLVSQSKCDYIQGWYYAKALPEKVAENFYREYMQKV